MTSRLFRKGSGKRGQGLVEFTLVFPLIALLLFAVFDLGRGVYAYNTIANSARQAARVAAVNQIVTTNTKCNEDMPIEDPSNPDWSVKACAVSAALALGLAPVNVNVTYSAPTDESSLICVPGNLHIGCIATVTVSYSYAPITPVIGNIVGPITISATSQMPIEYVLE
jgi:Flp pilus assembly protein TadG